jgi:hypothetical protein
MAPRQTVEEFRAATSALLDLLRAGAPLTEIEDGIIGSQIGSLRAELSNWRKRRTKKSKTSS